MICFRHKESGQIFTLLQTTVSSSGNYYVLGTDSKYPVSVEMKEIYNEYEEVPVNELNYDKVWPLIKNYMHLNTKIVNIFAAFFRRLTENYYEPGKYVIVWKLLHSHHSVENKILRIKGIFPAYNCSYTQVLILESTSLPTEEFQFPIFTDRFTDDDAYNNVKRLDLPF